MTKHDAQPETTKARRADQYNDPGHNYLRYWDGRDYEHAAEEIAIQRLLEGKHFKHAVDIGGGYGRLCVLLTRYADKVTLTDPSQQQLDIAKEYLKDYPQIDRKIMQAEDITLKKGSVDLVTMVRVMHHLPDPTTSLREIAETLAPKGYAIIEMANYGHARNRLRYFLKGDPLPEEPIDIRSAANKRKDEIPFVNHNPNTVKRQLEDAGFTVKRVLSVSNLRSPGLKKIVPKGAMLTIENMLQSRLASMYFGPSIFFLVQKTD